MSEGPVMDETAREVFAAIEGERSTFRALLDALTPADWERPTAGNETWTVQGAVSHLAGSDRSMASLLTSILEGAYLLEQAKEFALDDYNARQVSRRRDLPVDQLLRELDENRAAFLALVRRLGAEHWDAGVWWPGNSGEPGRELPLRERLLGYAAHDSVHGAQIRGALGR